MVFHDEVQQQIARSQNYLFTAYLPYLSVAFHFLFAATSKPPVHYPNASYEVTETLRWVTQNNII